VPVNAIGPGYVRTALNTALIEDAEFKAWVCAHAGGPLVRPGGDRQGGAVPGRARGLPRLGPDPPCRWRVEGGD
jgi:hypothetical protein